MFAGAIQIGCQSGWVLAEIGVAIDFRFGARGYEQASHLNHRLP
jgi:hypothetical protein